MFETPGGRRSVLMLFLVASLIAFHGPLYSLMSLSLRDDRYSFNLVIPFLSVFLVYLKRQALARGRYRCRVGIPLVLLGAILSYIAAGRPASSDQAGSLSVVVFALVLVWIGGFIACYGTQAFAAVIFPLCFLLWMVPIPRIALDKLSLLLQAGSAEAAYVLMKLTGVPVLRQGFTFSLPGLDIEVAQECSGIRSALALLITGSLASYILLRCWWSRSCLVLAIVPIAVFKNAVRIVTISYLGLYVSPDFLHGRLHRNGGLPFAMLAVAMLVPVLLLLRTFEVRRAEKARMIRCAEAGHSAFRSPELHGEAEG